MVCANELFFSVLSFILSSLEIVMICTVLHRSKNTNKLENNKKIKYLLIYPSQFSYFPIFSRSVISPPPQPVHIFSIILFKFFSLTLTFHKLYQILLSFSATVLPKFKSPLLMSETYAKKKKKAECCIFNKKTLLEIYYTNTQKLQLNDRAANSLALSISSTIAFLISKF